MKNLRLSKSFWHLGSFGIFIYAIDVSSGMKAEDMPVAFTQYYGAVLDAAQARSDLIANNIANADTPGFKARDISFDDVINAQLDGASGSHGVDTQQGGATPLYRAASTVTLDGNDVSLDGERLESAQTAERIQSVSTFLRQSTTDLITALRPNPSGS